MSVFGCMMPGTLSLLIGKFSTIYNLLYLLFIRASNCAAAAFLVIIVEIIPNVCIPVQLNSHDMNHLLIDEFQY